jgi:hypothetical protein
MEKRLDWSISRKRMEIQESFGRTIKVRSSEFISLHDISAEVLTPRTRLDESYAYFYLILSMGNHGSNRFLINHRLIRATTSLVGLSA